MRQYDEGEVQVVLDEDDMDWLSFVSERTTGFGVIMRDGAVREGIGFKAVYGVPDEDALTALLEAFDAVRMKLRKRPRIDVLRAPPNPRDGGSTPRTTATVEGRG